MERSAQELKIIGAEALMNLNNKLLHDDPKNTPKSEAEGVDKSDETPIIEPASEEKSDGKENGHSQAEDNAGPPAETTPSSTHD